MADKPKVAIMWLGGCGGCDEAVVDLNENVLKVASAVDFVLWPVALDFKYHHIEAMKDGEITLSIINGSVRNSELEEFAKVLRKKSQLVLAFGACACFGGTPGLANFRSRDDIFQWVYKDAPTITNPNNNYPQTTTNIDGKESDAALSFRRRTHRQSDHRRRLLPARLPTARQPYPGRSERGAGGAASSERLDPCPREGPL